MGKRKNVVHLQWLCGPVSETELSGRRKGVLEADDERNSKCNVFRVRR